MSEKATKISFLLAIFLCVLIVEYQLPLLQLRVAYASNSSRVIDLYTHKEPYSGRGPNQPSDAFAPQGKVILYAEVTYAGEPVQGKLVGFEVRDPLGGLFGTPRTAITNEIGIATVDAGRLPNETRVDLFGVWHVYASVDVAEETVRDTLTFKFGYIVQIISLETINADLQPQTRFARETCVGVKLGLRNIAMLPRIATLIIATYDNLSYQIGNITLEDFELQPGDTYFYLYCVLPIPVWAKLGWATVRAVAFSASLAEGGIAYCPEASARFLITWCDVAVVSVSPSPTAVNVGDLVSVNVHVVNEGFETESFDVSVYCNNILVGTLSVESLPPHQERTLIFTWNTSGVSEGSYTVSANASVVPGEIDVEDNSFVDGAVTVGVSLPPQPVYEFPIMLLIIMLICLGAMASTMILAFSYKKREIEKEKGRSGFSSGSFAGDSKGGGSSKPDESGGIGESGSVSSPRFLVVNPREGEFSSGYRRLEVSSLRKPFVMRPRVEASSMRSIEWSSQKPKEKSSLISSSVKPVNSRSSRVLAVVDLKRLREKK